MPRYRITDSTSGRTLLVEGDAPPTEADAEELFATSRAVAVAPPPDSANAAQSTADESANPAYSPAAASWRNPYALDTGRAIEAPPATSPTTPPAAPLNRELEMKRKQSLGLSREQRADRDAKSKQISQVEEAALRIGVPVASIIAAYGTGGLSLLAGAAGGFTGEVLAQESEMARGARDQVSYGQMAAAPIIAGTPLGPTLKGAAYAKDALIAARPAAIATRAAFGGGISGGADAISQVIDTGEVDLAEVLKSAAYGALFGGVIGGVETLQTTRGMKAAILDLRKRTGDFKSTDLEFVAKMQRLRNQQPEPARGSVVPDQARPVDQVQLTPAGIPPFDPTRSARDIVLPPVPPRPSARPPVDELPPVAPVPPRWSPQELEQVRAVMTRAVAAGQGAPARNFEEVGITLPEGWREIQQAPSESFDGRYWAPPAAPETPLAPAQVAPPEPAVAPVDNAPVVATPAPKTPPAPVTVPPAAPPSSPGFPAAVVLTGATSRPAPLTVPPAAPEVKPASRRQIAEQRAEIRRLTKLADQAAQSSPERAGQYTAQAQQAREKLGEMESNTITGPTPQVGPDPQGNADLLTQIADYVGKINMTPPANNVGGEYDGLAAAFSRGAARLLRSSGGGANIVNAIAELNESAGTKFTSPSQFFEAVDRAVSNRQNVARDLDRQAYRDKVEAMAQTDTKKGRPRALVPSTPNVIDQVGVGGEFKLNKEKFSVVDTDEGPGGIILYIIQDGHRFTIPEGTPIYPDKGSLKLAEVAPQKPATTGPQSTDPFGDNFVPEPDVPAAAAPTPSTENEFVARSQELQRILRAAGYSKGDGVSTAGLKLVSELAKKNGLRQWPNTQTIADYDALIAVVRDDLNLAAGINPSVAAPIPGTQADLVAGIERQAAAPSYPEYPAISNRDEPGFNIFTDTANRMKQWKADVAAWVETKPTKRPIIWEEIPNQPGLLGNVRALSPNIGDKAKPWRVTVFYPKDGKLMPAGHQIYATRAAAMQEEGRRIAKFYDRLPAEVMTEQDIQGYKMMADLDPAATLYRYQIASLDQVRERIRGSTLNETLVLDSAANGTIAFTAPVDPKHWEHLGIQKEVAPAAPAEALTLESASVGQQAAEAQAARETQLVAKRKANMLAANERPLTGDSSNVNQGQLYTEDADMFSGASAQEMAAKPAAPARAVGHGGARAVITELEKMATESVPAYNREPGGPLILDGNAIPFVQGMDVFRKTLSISDVVDSIATSFPTIDKAKIAQRLQAALDGAEEIGQREIVPFKGKMFRGETGRKAGETIGESWTSKKEVAASYGPVSESEIALGDVLKADKKYNAIELIVRGSDAGPVEVKDEETGSSSVFVTGRDIIEHVTAWLRNEHGVTSPLAVSKYLKNLGWDGYAMSDQLFVFNPAKRPLDNPGPNDKEAGRIDPQLLFPLARAVVGGIAGYLEGDTPEEKLAYALAGGLGLGLLGSRRLARRTLAALTPARAPVPSYPFDPGKPLRAVNAQGVVVGSHTMGALEHVRAIEMPELVHLARQLSNNDVGLRNFPKASGMFKARGTDFRIELDRRIFSDPVSAQRTMAHELGHMIDYLDDQTMNRGNLLGRIAVLRDHLRTTLPDTPWNPNQALQPKDRARLRRAAEKEVGKRPPADEEADLAAWKEAVAEEYVLLVQDEIESRGLIRDQEVRAELIAITEWWRPYEADKVSAGYIDYRNSSKELYADALSVLFNAPSELRDRAPVFFDAWMAYLDRKPEAKRALQDAWHFLHQGPAAVVAARDDRIKAGFVKAEEFLINHARERELDRTTLRGIVDQTKQEWWNIYQPIIARGKEVKAAGVKLPWHKDPEFFFDAHALAENENYLLLERLQRTVVAPLEASGQTRDDLGLYLFHNRVLNERYTDREGAVAGRSVIANPDGITPIQARMKLMLQRVPGLHSTPEQRVAHRARLELLESSARQVQDAFADLVRNGHQAGVFSDEQLALTEANRYAYAPFAVVDYLLRSDHVPAGIKQQVGTLQKVANPYLTFVLKGMAVAKLTELNRAKTLTVDLLTAHFPDSIERAPERKVALADGSMMNLPPPPAPRGKTTLTLLRKGKLEAYYVEPAYTKMFDDQMPASAHVVAKLLNYTMRNFFHPLFITYNPGFVYAANPMSDNLRSYYALPPGAARRKWIAENRAVWESARSRVAQDVATQDMPRKRALVALRKQRPLTPAEATELKTLEARGLAYEAIATRALASPADSFAADAVNTDDLWSRMLREHALLSDEPGRVQALTNKYLPTVVKTAKTIERHGMMSEALPKLATYSMLGKTKGWSREEIAFYVRNQIGTPNVYKKGSRAVFNGSFTPYINVFTRGMEADVALLRGKTVGPESRSRKAAEFWRRMTEASFVPSLLQALAMVGVFGAALKKVYDGFSDYDKTNYLIIPLGTWETDTVYGYKSAGIRIRLTETMRFGNAFLQHVVTRAADNDPAASASLAGLVEFGAGQVPGLHPLASMTYSWGQFAAGQQPRDMFRGSPVVQTADWKAGGWDRTKGMLAYTWGESGLGGMVRFDPKSQNIMEFSASATPVVNRLIRWSDSGLREREERIDKLDAEVIYKIRSQMPKVVNELLQEYSILKSMGERRDDRQEVRYKDLGAWHLKVWEPTYKEMKEAKPKDWSAYGVSLGIDSAPYGRGNQK